jgi:hypothetical protein
MIDGITSEGMLLLHGIDKDEIKKFNKKIKVEIDLMTVKLLKTVYNMSLDDIIKTYAESIKYEIENAFKDLEKD